MRHDSLMDLGKLWHIKEEYTLKSKGCCELSVPIKRVTQGSG